MVKFHDALIVSVSNFHNVITILNSCCVFVLVLMIHFIQKTQCYFVPEKTKDNYTFTTFVFFIGSLCSACKGERLRELCGFHLFPHFGECMITRSYKLFFGNFIKHFLFFGIAGCWFELARRGETLFQGIYQTSALVLLCCYVIQ